MLGKDKMFLWILSSTYLHFSASSLLMGTSTSPVCCC